MKERYEIHFVASGCKKVIIIEQSSMSDLQAWIAALLNHGECAGIIFSLRQISHAMAKARERQISKVRWNKASHTRSWSERAQLARNMVRLKNLQ